MKYLESIKLVQFFLFDKRDIQLREVTGVFGPTGSGKSSLIDAMQIAMLGAHGRLVSLNAQADENTSTRTIRSYCLGMHDEKRARDNATTYITLVWRDSVTKEPISMGVCLYASVDTDGHDVRGRYIVPGIELALQDHLEIVDNEERPRAWETFRHQLLGRSKVSGEDPFFTDSDRYIKALLLALRGSGGGAPSFDAFKSAFRFALRMRFNKSVDHIVRNDVLEARPTNIQKFKEVTESFRRLAQMVEQVKTKIADGEKVEAEFAKAAASSVRATTWGGLTRLVTREEAVGAMNHAAERRQEVEQEFAALTEKHVEANRLWEEAQNEEGLNRDLRINHPAHKEYGELQGAITNATGVIDKKSQEIRGSLNLIRNTLSKAAKSTYLPDNVSAIGPVVNAIDAALPTVHEINKEQLSAVVKPALKEASLAVSELFNVSMRVARELTDAKDSLKIREDAMPRVSKGGSRLSTKAECLLAELRNNGLNPTPVCDLVRITDPDWQPVIEAYLGRNADALLVEKQDEEPAFKLYRGLSGHRAIYGAKIVAASKQSNVAPGPGTVAELIDGDRPAAVSYLRRRFGDMLRATTDAEALAGHRTLTQDGMIVQYGEYDRIEPIAKADLKIGGGNSSQKEGLQREIADLKTKIGKLEEQQEKLKDLIDGLMKITDESIVMKYMLDACDEMHVARSTVNSLNQRLNDSADAEYVRLGELEQSWLKKAQELKLKVEQLQYEKGQKDQVHRECLQQEAAATKKMELAVSAAEAAVSNKEYDRDYASAQWDVLLEKHGDQYQEMAEYCLRQKSDAEKAMQSAIVRGARDLALFKEKYREQGSVNQDDWRNERDWMNNLLKRLHDTELSGFEAQMKDAFNASQETFRTDVAVALSNNIDHLDKSMERLNQVLRTCPVFSNGERYQFKRKVRPQLERLKRFVQDIAAFGPNDDLLGGAGEIPEEFRQLLDDKIAPGAAGAASPLDDYREFFEFDIEILREDLVTKATSVVGSLSKRLGTGSGGEHRAPLYVIAGAALASAYRLDSTNADGLRLILLDEAFNKMDAANMVATMRYLEELGLQVFMASPGENLGTLTAFLYRYYDIFRDVDNSTMLLEGHDVSEAVRGMLRSDLAEFDEELIAQELAAMRASKTGVDSEVAA